MPHMPKNNMIRDLKHFSTNLGFSYRRSIRYPTLSEIDFHKSHVIKALTSFETFDGNDALTPARKIMVHGYSNSITQ